MARFDRDVKNIQHVKYRDVMLRVIGIVGLLCNVAQIYLLMRILQK
jgi:hypothetical protein